ncbi:NAD(+) diphosphatase [Marinomonas agarivorans]|nr:NAD(+) diphosphatase [Marinomonas agarivorans]
MLQIGVNSHPIPHPEAIFLLMYKGNVLTLESHGSLLFKHQITDFQPTPETQSIYCGQWYGKDVFVCRLSKMPKGFIDTPLRDILLAQDHEHYALLSRARQLATWDADHQFCSRCGHPLANKHDREHTKICSNCHHRSYPRISPCIIVSIRKGKQLLLARGTTTQTRFSNIAGFVEAGETLEQAVEREVYEEVGLKIKNIRYYSSQPWSFPHQLMAGFFAEYESGEITPAPGEIIEADWYDIHCLPEVSPKASISGQLIYQHADYIKENL